MARVLLDRYKTRLSDFIDFTRTSDFTLTSKKCQEQTEQAKEGLREPLKIVLAERLAESYRC